jgi:hypothetical protein
MAGTRPLLVLVTGVPGSGKSTVADDAAQLLGAPVLAHDWVMSGLRPFSAVQEALSAMDLPGRGAVGWSILAALARAKLRRNRSVVLDGVARAKECGRVSGEEGAELGPDREIHRSRIENRDRAIPGLVRAHLGRCSTVTGGVVSPRPGRPELGIDPLPRHEQRSGGRPALSSWVVAERRRHRGLRSTSSEPDQIGSGTQEWVVGTAPAYVSGQ